MRPLDVVVIGFVPGAFIATVAALPILGTFLWLAASAPCIGIPMVLFVWALAVSVGGPLTAIPAVLVWRHRVRAKARALARASDAA